MVGRDWGEGREGKLYVMHAYIVCMYVYVFVCSFMLMPGVSGCVGMYVHGLHLCVCDCMSRCMYVVCLSVCILMYAHAWYVWLC